MSIDITTLSLSISLLALSLAVLNMSRNKEGAAGLSFTDYLTILDRGQVGQMLIVSGVGLALIVFLFWPFVTELVLFAPFGAVPSDVLAMKRDMVATVQNITIYLFPVMIAGGIGLLVSHVKAVKKAERLYKA